LSSQEAVLRFVAQTPGAVGYVSYCVVDARVKVALVITAAGQVSEDNAKINCPK
jgi:ABC-type phosphate transport system substrate-binding protein